MSSHQTKFLHTIFLLSLFRGRSFQINFSFSTFSRSIHQYKTISITEPFESQLQNPKTSKKLKLLQSISPNEENIQESLKSKVMKSATNLNDNGWTLEEDWALIDKVPIFTIGESELMKRTFWAQLLISSPELSTKSSEMELQKRYKELSSQYLEKEGKVLPSAGKSPPVLEDWFIENESGGRVVGVFDGRTVWFSSNMMGRIDGNSQIDNPLLPGGFVEAAGGRIYEFGQPNMNMNTLLNKDQRTKSVTESKGFRGIEWFTGRTALTATASALFASVILSFAVGYGAGLSLSSTSTNTYSREAALVHSKSAIVPSSSSVRIIERSSYTPSSGVLPERTISEKRAIKEAQVLNEQRRVQFLKDKLEKDEINLRQLRQEEITQSLSQ